MILRFDVGGLTVTKESSDRRMSKESTLYYHIVRALRNMGHDVVRQVPEKDGHLFSAPFYIRERKHKWALADENYALRSIAWAFNRNGWVRLSKYTLEGR